MAFGVTRNIPGTIGRLIRRGLSANGSPPSPTATSGIISFAEFEVPFVPTKGRVSFNELEVPLVPTTGKISFSEFEVPIVAAKGRISFAELRVPSPGEVDSGSNAMSGITMMGDISVF